MYRTIEKSTGYGVTQELSHTYYVNAIMHGRLDAHDITIRVYLTLTRAYLVDA